MGSTVSSDLGVIRVPSLMIFGGVSEQPQGRCWRTVFSQVPRRGVGGEARCPTGAFYVLQPARAFLRYGDGELSAEAGGPGGGDPSGSLNVALSTWKPRKTNPATNTRITATMSARTPRRRSCCELMV